MPNFQNSTVDNGWDFRPRCEECGNQLTEHWRGRACLTGGWNEEDEQHVQAATQLSLDIIEMG